MNLWAAAGDLAFAVCLAVAAVAIVVAALAVRDTVDRRVRRHITRALDDPDAVALRRARAVTSRRTTRRY